MCGYTSIMQLQDVKKIAQLARISVPDEELESIAKDMDSILGYIKQIEEVSVDSPIGESALINCVREDIVSNETGLYTDSILALAPHRDGNFVKVKKIL